MRNRGFAAPILMEHYAIRGMVCRDAMEATDMSLGIMRSVYSRAARSSSPLLALR